MKRGSARYFPLNWRQQKTVHKNTQTPVLTIPTAKSPMNAWIKSEIPITLEARHTLIVVDISARNKKLQTFPLIYALNENVQFRHTNDLLARNRFEIIDNVDCLFQGILKFGPFGHVL